MGVGGGGGGGGGEVGATLRGRWGSPESIYIVTKEKMGCHTWRSPGVELLPLPTPYINLHCLKPPGKK